MLKLFLTKWPFWFKLRLILGLILLVVILFFLYFKIVPFGHITYSRSWPANWQWGQGFISSLKPNNRLDLSNRQSTKIIANPVYFSVFTPRGFNQVTVEIKYRDRLSSTTPIIELGVLKDQLTGNYNLQPLQNNILDHWSANWSRLGKSNFPLILQANKNYFSVSKFLSDLKSGFLKNCPKGLLTCVAVYNYPLKLNYSLPRSTLISPFTITQPLRGAHQFYLYLKNKKPWRLSINFTYLRLDPKLDPITVNIWFGNKIIMSQSILDNNSGSLALKIKNQRLIFKGSAPVAGVYKVEIKINQDVVIKSIESSSNKLVVIHKIWPVSGSGGLTLFTDVNHLRVQTSNPASLDKIIFGHKIFNLAKTYRPFHWFSSEKLPIIKIKKDDIILANNGVFAFSKSSLFNPDLKKVDRYFLPSDDTKYIIANYQEPLENKGLKIAKAKFNLSDAYRFAGRYTFVISIPGLAGQKGSKNYLEIKEIILNLSGKTLWQKIWP